MTSTDVTQAISYMTKQGGALDHGRDCNRLMVQMFHLLSSGQPVSQDRVEGMMTELGIEDQAQARTFLESCAERNDNGDIVGLGLTCNPTPHQMSIGGAQLWAWCAADAMMMSNVLNKQVTIESMAPGATAAVRMDLGPDGITHVSSSGAVLTQAVADDQRLASSGSSMAAMWPSLGKDSFLFPSRGEAMQWASGRQDIAMLSMDDAFMACQQMAAACMRYES